MTEDIFNLNYYDFQIPKGLVAQEPAAPRDSCRLLVVNRENSCLKREVFKDIVNYFKKGDLLVLNNTKVIRAKLFARKMSGGKLEILLLKQKEKGVWEVLVNPGKRVRVGDVISFEREGLEAKILEKTSSGSRIIKFNLADFENFLSQIGTMPLPPYIKKEIQDSDDYQTVYARHEGAVAAPTAGLHFTPELIRKIEVKGVKVLFITLHCGLATFRPVKCEDIRNHPIESEWVEISLSVTKAINKAKQKGRRIIAVGTTGVRALEAAASEETSTKAFSGSTNFYITPGYKFKVIDALITNFHTPLSTNLILVSSFANPALIKKSYLYAKDEKFRFYSFGDAMLIL